MSSRPVLERLGDRTEGCPVCFPGEGPVTEAARAFLEPYHREWERADGSIHYGYHQYVEHPFEEVSALLVQVEREAGAGVDSVRVIGNAPMPSEKENPMGDYVCKECGWRVGDGPDSPGYLERHIRREHSSGSVTPAKKSVVKDVDITGSATKEKTPPVED